MNIQFFSNDFELSHYKEFRELVEKRLNHLKRYFRKILNVRVEIGESKPNNNKKAGIFRVEINLQIPKKILRAEENGKTLDDAFHKAYENIKIQILRYKEKENNKI